MLIGLETNWFEKTFKIPKAIRRSKIIAPIIATAAAVALIPGLAPAIRSGVTTAGRGLSALAKQLAGGAKLIGKTAKDVIIRTTDGRLVKYLLPQEEIKQINRIKQTQQGGLPLMASGIEIEELPKGYIKQQTGAGVSAGVNPMKVLPLAVGGISLIASIYKLTR